MQRHYWTAISARPRLDAISGIQDVIQRYGCMVSFTAFSDVALALTVEIPSARIGSLHAALATLVRLEPESMDNVEEAGEALLMLHITFTRGTGNLAREIPPG